MTVSVLFLLSIGWMVQGKDCGTFSSGPVSTDENACKATTFPSGICTFDPATGVCSGGSGCEAYVGSGNYPADNSACAGATFSVPCSFNPADGSCAGSGGCGTGHDSTTKTFPSTYSTCTDTLYNSSTACQFDTQTGSCNGFGCGVHTGVAESFPNTNEECSGVTFNGGPCNFNDKTGACTGGGGCQDHEGTPKWPATYVGCTNLLRDNIEGCEFSEKDGSCLSGGEVNAVCSAHASTTKGYPTENGDGRDTIFCLYGSFNSTDLCQFDSATGACTGGLDCEQQHNTYPSYPNEFPECTDLTYYLPCYFNSLRGTCMGAISSSSSYCSGHDSTEPIAGECTDELCYSDNNGCGTTVDFNGEQHCRYDRNYGSCEGSSFGKSVDGMPVDCTTHGGSPTYTDTRHCSETYVQIRCTYNSNDGKCYGGGNCTDYRQAEQIYKDVNSCESTPAHVNCSYDPTGGNCYGSDNCYDVHIPATAYTDGSNCGTTQGTAGTCSYDMYSGSCYGADVCFSKGLNRVYKDTNGECAADFVKANCEYAGAATGKCTGNAVCLANDASADLYADANNCGTTLSTASGNCVYDQSTGSCTGGLGSTCSSKSASSSSFTDSGKCALHTGRSTCTFAVTTGCTGNIICSMLSSFPGTYSACTDNSGCTYAATTGECTGTYDNSGSMKIAFPAVLVVLGLLFLL